MSRIVFLNAKNINDSRGDLTIEVTIGLESGIQAIASVPQGKSRGKEEAFLLKAEKAVENVNQLIALVVKNKEFENSKELDEFLITLDGTNNKSKLGANAILAVSIAFVRALALEKKIPLWQEIRNLFEEEFKEISLDNGKNNFYKIPRLFVNIIGGGLHAKNNLDFQEYLIIPKTQNPADAFEISKIIYNTVGDYLKEKYKNVSLADEGNFAPNLSDNEEPFLIIKEAMQLAKLNNEIDLGLDAAASNVKLDSKKLFDWYINAKEKYNLFYLEDPFAEEDFESFASLLNKVGNSTIIAGDDLTVTNFYRIRQAYEKKSINGVIIKPNQIGTLTETIKAIKKAKELGLAIIISHRSGETNDDFIADLAYGVGADGLKAGAPLAPERAVKYKRLIELVSKK